MKAPITPTGLVPTWFIVCRGTLIVTQFQTIEKAEQYAQKQNKMRVKGTAKFEVVAVRGQA